MFEASAVFELGYSSKGDVWSVTSFLSSLWNIFHPIEMWSHKFNLQESPFIMELILMKNINKTPMKINNVNDDGNK